MRQLQQSLLLLCLAWFAGPLYALPVTYTFSAQIDGGSVDGVAFGSTTLTLTGFADTDDVTTFQVGTNTFFSAEHSSTELILAGVGTFDILSPIRTLALNFQSGFGSIGFSLAGDSQADLGVQSPSTALGGYDLGSDFGPFTGEGRFLQWLQADIMSDGGQIVINDVTTDITFTVAVSQVPVPAPLLLLFSGLGVLALFRRSVQSPL